MKADGGEDRGPGSAEIPHFDEAAVAKAAGTDPQEAARTARKLEKRLRKAREAAGLPPLTTYQPVALKAATGQVRASVDPDVIKTAVTEATSALAADLTAMRDAFGERFDAQQKVLDAIADQPDPRVEAYRGPVFNKTPAAAVPQPVTAAGYEDTRDITLRASQAVIDLRNETARGWSGQARNSLLTKGANSGFLTQFGALRTALSTPSIGEQIAQIFQQIPGGAEALAKSFTAGNLGRLSHAA
jgi:hypothetical protein